jgi:hypothetical protein
VTSLADLRPGDLLFGPISGWVGDLVVGPGQILVAPWKHQLSWRQWWRIRHCATVTRAALDNNASTYVDRGAGPRIAQATPPSYEEITLGLGHWTRDYLYVRPPWRYPGQGEDVARYAREMARRKVRYGFANYPRIAAHRAHIPAPRLDRFIARTDADGYPIDCICSQGCDAALTLGGGLVQGEDGGWHVFTDGRLPQDVVPSELYLLLLGLPGVLVMRPGSPAVGSPSSLQKLPRRRREPGSSRGWRSK